MTIQHTRTESRILRDSNGQHVSSSLSTDTHDGAPEDAAAGLVAEVRASGVERAWFGFDDDPQGDNEDPKLTHPGKRPRPVWWVNAEYPQPENGCLYVSITFRPAHPERTTDS